MAGRQLQRLLKEQQPSAIPEDSDEATSSEEEEDEAPARPAFNPFDLLTDGDSDQVSDEEDDDEASGEEDNPEEADDNLVTEKVPDRTPAPVPAAPSAAKKDKGAASGRNTKKTATAAEEEDIDAILQELNITPLPASDSSSNADGSTRSLLAVNPANLKAEEELRRMFGSMGVRGAGRDNEDPAAAYAGASRRVRRLAARGLLRPVHGALRPGALITPRETWPRPDGGLTLQSVGPDSSGNPTFQLSFSSGYQAVQELYEECQATFDPNAVAALLRSHPFHIDALLTMADVYRAMAENAYADEMIERCVYALEMGWPPGFMAAATAGTARVVFEERNEALFVGLFRYVQALGRRGLHRTALEVCKLLLQLDSDDPMGVLQTIDYFAVRSGQYDFLQRFVEGQGAGVDSASVLLPNMVFSLALAKWYQEQHDAEKLSKKDKQQGGSSSTSANDTAAALSGQPTSEDLLVKAVLLHPLVIVRLHAKLSEKGMGRDSRWSDALSHPLLARASDGGNPGLSHLVDIFIERQAALWQAGPLQEWLIGGIRRACGCNAADLPDGLSAADWAAVREQAFPPAESNAYSHLRIHDYSDSVPRLPPEEIHGMQGVAPGMAPGGLGAGAGGIAIPDEMQEVLIQELARAEAEIAGGGNVENLRDMHPLVALLRSLLPWDNEAQQPDYGAEEEEE